MNRAPAVARVVQPATLKSAEPICRTKSHQKGVGNTFPLPSTGAPRPDYGFLGCPIIVTLPFCPGQASLTYQIIRPLFPPTALTIRRRRRLPDGLKVGSLFLHKRTKQKLLPGRAWLPFHCVSLQVSRPLRLGGVDQWVLIRGVSTANRALQRCWTFPSLQINLRSA